MDTLTLLWAALCLLCVKCETLTQPGSVTVQPGHTLTLPCTVSYDVTYSNGYFTGWIRHPAGKGLEWIGYHCAGCVLILKDSLKNKFSINVDSSSNTVTLRGQNMQPGDTAVYYCARQGSRSTAADYFDYWGKGTQVTVTSATPTAPTVFPVMPCTSGSEPTVTLACLATGFSPSSVSFTWTRNGSSLADSIQYPSILKDNLYSGISQIRIRRQDWDQRNAYKCKVDHAAGIREVDFIKPHVVYQLPNLTMMMSEANEQVTFSCLANDFSPKVFDFQWLKDNVEIKDANLVSTMPSKATKTSKGSVYSAASFLTVPTEDLHGDNKFMCKFNLGKGATLQTVNETQKYKSSEKCGADSFIGTLDIIPPSVEDMLYYGDGKIRCEVNVDNPSRLLSVSWYDEHGTVLMNDSDARAQKIGGRVILDLDIKYTEWNSGITRECVLYHEDLLDDPIKKIYKRNNDVFNPPAVFMLAPLKQTKDAKVTLTCYVKNFMPKEIYVTWLIDDMVSVHEFNTTNSMKTNGAYYAYSHLTVPLKEWEESEQVYSCLVYHEAIEMNKHIVRSITQNFSQQTTMVNLNMKFPDMCKA